MRKYLILLGFFLMTDSLFPMPQSPDDLYKACEEAVHIFKALLSAEEQQTFITLTSSEDVTFEDLQTYFQQNPATQSLWDLFFSLLKSQNFANPAYPSLWRYRLYQAWLQTWSAHETEDKILKGMQKVWAQVAQKFTF